MIKEYRFDDLDVNNNFFDDLRSNYPGFNQWFKLKAGETLLAIINDNTIDALMYLKEEFNDENYDNVKPIFKTRHRLKIGTFKVANKQLGYGSKLMKKAFDRAHQLGVDEIYITFYNKGQEDLINFLKHYGFIYYGKKNNEEVYIKYMEKTDTILLPIDIEYINEIFAGNKKYEFRKIRPKHDIEKIIMYATSPIKMVVGEVEVLSIIDDNPNELWNRTYPYTGCSREFYDKYYRNTSVAYAYVIGKVTKYSEPKTLEEIGVNHTPQSFIYL